MAGGTYFFTVVTDKRQKILCLPKNVSLLRDAFGYVMQKCIWTLPENDHDFSNRMNYLV